MDKNITDLKLLRDEFVKRYSRDKLETMTIDEYSLNTIEGGLYVPMDNWK